MTLKKKSAENKIFTMFTIQRNEYMFWIWYGKKGNRYKLYKYLQNHINILSARFSVRFTCIFV